MGKLVEHWSYSSLELYQRCPWAWYKSYVEKVKQPEVEVFKIGKALHYALQKNAECFLSTENKLSYEQAVKYYKESYDKAPVALLDSYFRASKWVEALALKYIEWDFMLDCFGAKLKGVIDIITKDKIVLDYKTASKPYATYQVQESLQLTLYAGAFYEEFKELPYKVGYQVILKDYSGVQNLYDARSLVQIEKAKELVKKCDNDVNNTTTFAHKEGKNCYWCAYRGVCK